MPTGRGQKRVKYQGDDTGKELEEPTEIETQGDEELPDQRPSKCRRTLEIPAREAARATQETFLQVFNRFMKTRAPKIEKGSEDQHLLKQK